MQGWEPSERTSYEYDEATGRLSSSTTTLESEWSEQDRAWIEALLYLEKHQGPHGFPTWESHNPDYAATNPDATHTFIAGDPVTNPETGAQEWAGTYDWAEKVRLDFLDRARGNTPDPLNGLQVPVHLVRRPKPVERGESPLARRRAQRKQGPPPTTEP